MSGIDPNMIFTDEVPRPTLEELLDRARTHVMTPEEQEAQRQSWVTGEIAMGTDADEARERGLVRVLGVPLSGLVVNVPATGGGNITYEMVKKAAGLLDAVPMTFAEYQQRTHKTAVFPHHVPDELAGVVYCALGLAGEAGEVAGKVKKLLRDGDSPDKRRKIVAEVGDTLWYIPELLHELGEFTLEQCARENIAKLLGRSERDTLKGDGDNR